MWWPPVCRVGPHAADVEQEDDALEVALGGGEVQRGAAVVVRGGHVHALQVQPLQRRRVARHRREQQRHHRQTLLLGNNNRKSIKIGIIEIAIFGQNAKNWTINASDYYLDNFKWHCVNKCNCRQPRRRFSEDPLYPRDSSPG